MQPLLVPLYYFINTDETTAVKENFFEIPDVSRGLRASHAPNPTVKDRSSYGFP